MGMDVYGKAPETEEGKYFRASVWSWHPIADMVTAWYPSLTGNCQYWHSNDGDGLDAEDAKRLGDALAKDIEAGTVRVAIAEYETQLAALPREKCEYCNGSGVRTDEVGVNLGMPTKEYVVEEDGKAVAKTGWCNGCDGEGSRESSATWYRMDLEHVKEFAAFLKTCGGFEIW